MKRVTGTVQIPAEIVDEVPAVPAIVWLGELLRMQDYVGGKRATVEALAVMGWFPERINIYRRGDEHISIRDDYDWCMVARHRTGT